MSVDPEPVIPAPAGKVKIARLPADKPKGVIRNRAGIPPPERHAVPVDARGVRPDRQVGLFFLAVDRPARRYRRL